MAGARLEHRAWDLLEPVLAASRGERAQRLGRLYDLWVATKYNPAAMRRHLADVDLAPLVSSFETWYRQHVRPLTATRAVTHVRILLPVGASVSVAGITPARLAPTNGRGAHELSWRTTAPGLGGHGCGLPRESQSSIRHTIWSASM